MGFIIKDRKAAAQIKYQIRRFIKQASEHGEAQGNVACVAFRNAIRLLDARWEHDDFDQTDEQAIEAAIARLIEEME